ncbi:MAG TPA: metallophosphoesterase [Burkholderiales bacterium]
MNSSVVLPSPAPATRLCDAATGIDPALAALAARIGAAHLEQRLERERGNERRVQRAFERFFYVDGPLSAHAVIRTSLRLVGLHGRARRNARALVVRTHEVPLPGLPRAFDGYTILHISDPHLDLSADIPAALIERVRTLDYDLCVLTGDYRTQVYGPWEPTLEAMSRVRPHLKREVYAVLGNHDSLRMVPGLEALDVRVLLNEAVEIRRGSAVLHLGGIDDAHFYRLHDFPRLQRTIPPDAPAILLSHTPEAYAEAEAAGFRLMLAGHTHGGQICLPGGIPLITDADCPRRYARGSWRHGRLIGYTSAGSGSSIVDVRLNCPPEVTLHRLHAA